MVRNRRRVREFTIDNMEIKITTYTDNEKVYEDKHFGEFSEEISYEKIVYNDKNECIGLIVGDYPLFEHLPKFVFTYFDV